MSLVQKIKMLAEEKHTTFAEIERKIGISNGQIRRWDTASPKTENLEKVADLFEVSLDYLLGKTEIRNSEKNQSPSWATKDDVVDLKKMLQANQGMTYGDEKFDEADIQRLNGILEAIYWEKRVKKRNEE